MASGVYSQPSAHRGAQIVQHPRPNGKGRTETRIREARLPDVGAPAEAAPRSSPASIERRMPSEEPSLPRSGGISASP